VCPFAHMKHSRIEHGEMIVIIKLKGIDLRFNFWVQPAAAETLGAQTMA
jgi:hypothetical protein